MLVKLVGLDSRDRKRISVRPSLKPQCMAVRRQPGRCPWLTLTCQLTLIWAL